MTLHSCGFLLLILRPIIYAPCAPGPDRAIETGRQSGAAGTPSHAPVKRSRLPRRLLGGNRMNPVFRAAAFAVVVCVALVLAQAPGIQRTVVYKADVSVPGREAVVARVELAPGASAGRHTHFGDEITYVMEGEAEILIEGQPN